jgi:hypothetical protein
VKSFNELLNLGSVEALANDPDVAVLYSWDSSNGRRVQTAAIVLAMRQVEKTAERLDAGAVRLQRWALGLAWASLAVSAAALVVAVATT